MQLRKGVLHLFYKMPNKPQEFVIICHFTPCRRRPESPPFDEGNLISVVLDIINLSHRDSYNDTYQCYIKVGPRRSWIGWVQNQSFKTYKNRFLDWVKGKVLEEMAKPAAEEQQIDFKHSPFNQ